MLIIDTSSEKLKVILNKNKQIYVNKNLGSKHLQYLLPEIDNLFTSSNSTLKDVDIFCVVCGPGSFTGVRIGVSTVKAFSMALPDKKIVSINMFDLLSYSIFSKLQIKSKVSIIIKSTATKYYYALISSTGLVEQMKLLTNVEIEKEVKDNNALLFSYNQDYEFEGLKATKITLIDEDYINFSKTKVENQNFVQIQELKPLYLALSQAEEELLKKAKNNV